MSQWGWRVGGVVAIALLGVGVGKLAAQAPRARAKPTRAAIARNPVAAQSKKLSRQQVLQKAVRAQAVLRGLVLLFEYDGNHSVDLDLDDNGFFLDTGDRAIRGGYIWLSNGNGARLREIGRFASSFDYLDVSGEATGTDILQQTDMFIAGSGQVRAGGFWDVADGVGDPTLGVSGATGVASIRRYGQGQLIFLGEIGEGEELYFLAR